MPQVYKVRNYRKDKGVYNVLFKGGFNPRSARLWLDPSDFSSMYQDNAATIPVTAVGQTVGFMRDKTGRGFNASQGNAAARPTLRQDAQGYYYLEYVAASSMSLDCGSSPVPAGSPNHLIVALQSTAAATVIGTVFVNGLSVSVEAFLEVDNGIIYTDGVNATGNTSANPTLAVVQAKHLSNYKQVAGNFLVYRVNGANVAIGGATTPTTARTGGDGYRVGVREPAAGQPYGGRFYGLLLFDKALSASQEAKAERWLANKTGIALP